MQSIGTWTELAEIGKICSFHADKANTGAAVPDAAVERAFCTTREAADLLGVSVGTVQMWVETGLLNAWKTGGGHRRIYRTSVDQLLRDKSPGGAGHLAHSDAPVSGTRPTVMVVEDDAALLKLYETRLTKWPLRPEVLLERSGFSALLRLGRVRPDMLILDLNMPGMDGFALLQSLRQTEQFRAMAVVVVSGLDQTVIEDRGGLPSGVTLLAKPIRFAKLAEIWNEVISSMSIVRR